MVPHAAPMATQELVDLDRQDHEAFMKQRADFLQEDLKHLFDDKGITKDQYDNVVEFRDPCAPAAWASHQCRQPAGS